MLIGHVIELAHNKLGHNGISRTYAMLKQLYYWRGMKASITIHVKFCDICQKRNIQVVPYAKLHFDTATLEFVSMDIVRELYPPSKASPYSDLHANWICFLHTLENKTGK